MSHRGRVEPRRTVQGLHVNRPSFHRDYIYSIFPFFAPIRTLSFPRFEFPSRPMYLSTNACGGAQFTSQRLSIHFRQIYTYICIVEKRIESFEALDKRGERGHIGNKSLSRNAAQ